MNKKGFTLIEVIGVVIILCFIILTITPNISDSLKNSRNKAYETQISEIKSAAKSWSIYNSDNLPDEENSEIVITLLQLKLGGFISHDFKNPKTGDLFADDMQIKITKNGQNYVYSVLDDTGSNSFDSIDPTGPQIILIGSTYMIIEVNSSAEIPGAVYKNSVGINVNITDIKYEKNVDNTLTEVDSVNVDELGSYVITYTATVGDKTNSIKRYVEIRDTISPEIIIDGYNNEVCQDWEMNGSFVLPSAQIIDNYTNLITPTISGNISNVPGIKKITYEAKDSSNNVSKFVLCVNFKDTTKPTMEVVETESNELNAKILTVNASDSGVGLHENAYSFDGGSSWQKENYFVVRENYDRSKVIVVVRDRIGLQTSPFVVYSEKEFLYTRNEEIYIVPKTGYYKLQVWGASGGNANDTYIGGYGAYAEGMIYLEQNERLYINVGGKGETTTTEANQVALGGYNGGGSALNHGTSTNRIVGSGGGATHIAKSSGLLSTLSTNIDDILIVAGGGGGGEYYTSNYYGFGGSGGGLVGLNGTGSTNGIAITSGGTQTGAGTEGTYKGSFGQGANYSTASTTAQAGGGGGLYGGNIRTTGTGGGGGSSYIGNPSLINKYMYYYGTDMLPDTYESNYLSSYVSEEAIEEHAKIGDGEARITFVSSTYPNPSLDHYGEYVYKVEESGYYKLEAWGAQGGSTTKQAGSASYGVSGYGGYAKGVSYLTKGTNLYITIGSRGDSSTNAKAYQMILGGYNGGGTSISNTTSTGGYVGSGGGATHIAMVPGLLSTLSGNISDILMVAGGSGGTYYYGVGAYTTMSGSGGGKEGTAGTGSSTVSGGTQTGAGATGTIKGTFGQGATATTGLYIGGGGGYYGGNGNNRTSGGGSGYIGNSQLTTYEEIEKSMYCYNCTTSDDINTKTYTTTNVSESAIENYVKIGDGAARITYLTN